MRQLSEFLIKYKDFGLKEKISKEAFVKSVNETIGQEVLKVGDVLVEGSTLRVRASSIVRSEIIVRKSEIFKKLESYGALSFGVKHLR